MLGPIIVPGKPLDPALGLPSAVFRVRAWPQWAQVAIGGVLFVFGLWVILPGEPSWWGMPIDLVIPIVGGFMLAEAANRLRHSACLIVAEHGFDDRVTARGPVQWRDVTGMQVKPTSSRKTFELVVGVMGRDGKAHERRIAVSELFGSAEPVVDAMGGAWERAKERSATFG